MIDFLISTVPWIANFLILWGGWEVGKKKRHAFFYYIAGELAWVWYAIVYEQLWSLAVVCMAFALMSLRNWVKWGNMIDHDNVLHTYIDIIGQCEGITYIDQDNNPAPERLTEKEWKYLKSIRDRAYKDVK